MSASRLPRRVLVLAAVLCALVALLGWIVTRDRRAASIARPDPFDVDASARVLFIGNSLTYVNDLPALVRALAEKDGRTIAVFTRAFGGAKLEQHAADAVVRELLRKRWDYVVLQEQSQLPSFEDQRATNTSPAIGALLAAAKGGGAKVVLFATWGYRDGDRENVPNDTYDAMQRRLDDGFDSFSKEHSIPLVPVNAAWAEARRQKRDAGLWAPDGHHPGLDGSYLAACVFYASLFGRSPRGNAFTAGLPAARATELQDIAARIALAR